MTIPLFTRARAERCRAYEMTSLELCGPRGDLQVRFLSGDFDKRQRRLVVRSLFQCLKPWIAEFASKGQVRAGVGHAGRGGVFKARDLERGIFVPIERKTRLGFHIRMRRLDLRLSQAELAARLLIARPHLSAIERGLHFPRSEILRRLEREIGDLSEFR